MLEIPKVSGQRIQGEIGDERNIKRKRDDTETDLQWVKKGKKRFVAFVRMCCDKLKKVNWANESEADNLGSILVLVLQIKLLYMYCFLGS